MRILIGLILQMTSIYFIGNSIFVQELLKSKTIGIVYLCMGVVLWAFSYFILFDIKGGTK